MSTKLVLLLFLLLCSLMFDIIVVLFMFLYIKVVHSGLTNCSSQVVLYSILNLTRLYLFLLQFFYSLPARSQLFNIINDKKKQIFTLEIRKLKSRGIFFKI